jgi:predicted transcriptional regulator
MIRRNGPTMKRDPIVRADHCNRVLAYLARGPKTFAEMVDDLAARMPESELSAVRWQLKDEGAIESDGKNQTTRYSLTDIGRAKVAA